MEKLIDTDLDKFNVRELSGILKNAKLGGQHLRCWLTHHQYQHLLSIGQLSDQQKKSLKADIEEKSGNAARILNTLLTSVLGFWIGLSDFLDAWKKSNIEVGFIIVGCVAAAIFIGNLAYRSVGKEAKESIEKIKLANFQLKILNAMLRSKEKSLMKLSSFISQLLPDNGSALWQHEEPKEDTDIEQHIVQKLQHLRDELLENDYTPYKSLLSSLTELLNSLVEDRKKKQLALIGKGDLQTLTDPNLSALASKPRKTLWQWLSENKMKVLLDTLPVILGTAASLFVFILGVPSAAEKLGFHHTPGFFNIANAKIIAVAIAISITIYFGISQCKFLYRSFKRSAEFEAVVRKVAAAEEKQMRLSNLYNMCLQLKEKLKSPRHQKGETT